MNDDNTKDNLDDLVDENALPDEDELEEVEKEVEELDLDDIAVEANKDYYSDDVAAEAIAEANLNPDALVEDDEPPVTTGEMELGDLDIDVDDVDLTASDDEEDDPVVELDD